MQHFLGVTLIKSPEFIWCNWRCNDYTKWFLKNKVVKCNPRSSNGKRLLFLQSRSADHQNQTCEHLCRDSSSRGLYAGGGTETSSRWESKCSQRTPCPKKDPRSSGTFSITLWYRSSLSITRLTRPEAVLKGPRIFPGGGRSLVHFLPPRHFHLPMARPIHMVAVRQTDQA